MRRRFLPALLLVLFGLVVAACGSKATTGSGGGSTPEGAELVRAGIVAFVTVDSDTGSSQWQQLDKLAQKFPGRDRALEQIKEAFTKEGVDWESDVQPALGPELDIAVADGQAAITDVLKGDRPALSGDDAFKQALDKLPGEALVKAYVDGQRVDELFTEAASARGGGFDAPSLGLDTLKYIAAAVSAEESGLRIRGASSGGPGGGGDFASKLLGGVPGDALALLDFEGSGTTDQLGRLKSNPQVAAAIAQVEQQLNVTLDELIALFSGENAFYVRSGIGIPELTLVLGGHDQGAALATLDKLAANLAAATGGKIEAGSQGGHPVKTVDLGQFAIHYGGVDGKVILTSGVSGIADYGSSDSLSDSADFKEARSAAGMPDSTGAFTYL